MNPTNEKTAAVRRTSFKGQINGQKAHISVLYKKIEGSRMPDIVNVEIVGIGPDSHWSVSIKGVGY